MTGEGKAARSDSAERARVRLVGALDGVLGERLVIEPGTKPDYYADGVAVSGFDLLERCPRRAAQPADDYQDSVANARRRVGLLTLRRLDDDASDAPDVAAAVAEVMSDPTGWPGSLRDWVDGLDRAGRAAVAAGVITWCISLRRVLRTDRRIGWSDPVGPDRYNVPGRLVQLRASHEAIAGGVVSGEQLLVLADGVEGAGGPADRLRAGHVALVRALLSRHAPLGVTVVSPARGEKVHLEVDDELLDLAVDRVAEHVAHRVAGESAPTVPGRWCAHCHLLEGCGPGRDRVGDPVQSSSSGAEPTT